MNDAKTTIADLKLLMKEFTDVRDWNQFHTPKNLSTKLAIEAAELMELFVWKDGQASFDVVRDQQQAVKDELADVICLVFAFANACSIDISAAVIDKLAVTGKRYPIEKCKGKSDKYTAYVD